MIASYACNFIFIRTRKTASTSTEIVLGSWCGPNDIITPVGVDDEFIRRNFGGEPANFCSDSELEHEYRTALRSGDRHRIAKLYRQVMSKLAFHHHMSANEIQPLVAPEFWSSAFKFAVDRNPYEKVLSILYWRERKSIAAGASANDFIDRYISGGEYRNFDLYSINGELAVDRVFRYEELWAEIGVLGLKLGRALPAERPNSKAQYRQDRRPARDVLSAKQREEVFEICREEFDLLGYER